MLARRKLSQGGRRASQVARDLGKASYLTSVFGIVVELAAAAIIAVVLLSVVSRLFADAESLLQHVTYACDDHRESNKVFTVKCSIVK